MAFRSSFVMSSDVVMIANTEDRGIVDRAAVRILCVLNQGSERDGGMGKPIDEPPDEPEELKR
jgi:hypothetical protein